MCNFFEVLGSFRTKCSGLFRTLSIALSEFCVIEICDLCAIYACSLKNSVSQSGMRASVSRFHSRGRDPCRNPIAVHSNTETLVKVPIRALDASFEGCCEWEDQD